jgi:GxxExxY protein
MKSETERSELDALTEKIIVCAYTVGNVLGCGFLEKVYENAFSHELRRNGLTVEQQHPVNVYYDEVIVGEYFADIVVNGKVLVELKAAKEIDQVHIAQCLNYLNATRLRVCLLINFGKPKVEIKRIVRDF